MRYAITRPVSRCIDRCELTHREREPIDLYRAAKQHGAYVDRLRSLGCTILTLPEEPDLPDSVFVEDTAIVLDDLAFVTRPGAESRRGELPSVKAALEPFRTVFEIGGSGTLDGGDVLWIGRDLYVGLSSRTNEAAIQQLRLTLSVISGYHVIEVPVDGCLHLKSAVTRIGEDAILINSDRVDASKFGNLKRIEVPKEEPDGANVLLIGDTVICSSAYPRTEWRLVQNGFRVETLDMSELAKAEGALTCCSLIFEGPDQAL